MKKNYNPWAVGIIIAVIVVLYMAGPIDFLPDFISGLGQIDDGLVLLVGLVAEIVTLVTGLNLVPANVKAEAYSEPEHFEGYENAEYGEYREV